MKPRCATRPGAAPDWALTILDWMWEWGWDKEYGGIIYFVDVEGPARAGVLA